MDKVLFNDNGKIAMQANWLWNNGIITDSNYYQQVSRGKITVLHRSAPGCPAIISYETLPHNIKTKIEDKLKELKELPSDDAVTVALPSKSSNPCYFEVYIQPDPAAMDYYTAKFHGDYERINRYYNNAIVMNGLMELYQNRIADRKSRQKTGRLNEGLFATIIADLKSLSELTVDGKPKYPHTLPMSERNLRPLLKEYRKTGYAALIHANDGNMNAQVVTPELELLLMSIYCMENKPYAFWVYEDYIHFTQGKKEIMDYATGEVLNLDDYRDDKGEVIMVSESTVWNVLNKPENRLIVDAVRSSNHTFRHKYLPHYMRRTPQYSLSLVSCDDYDLPRPLEGGGHVYAYYAFDVMSGMIIGVAHSREKKEPLFLACMRNMYHNLSEWGFGLPLEIQVENHLCSKFKDTFLKSGNLFKYVTFCSPTNSQEKHAEPLLHIKKYCADKRLQQNVGRHYARLEANRTEGVRFYNEETNEYEHKYKTFSYEQIVAEDMQSVEYYNNMLHRFQKKYAGISVKDAFFGNVNADVAPINHERVFYYLGQWEKTSIVRHQYVNLQSSKYWLSSPEVFRLLSPNNYNVVAHWLPDRNGKALDEAYIYQGEQFIGRVCRLEHFSAAKAEWTDADTVAKLKQTEYIDSVAEFVAERKNKIMGVRFTDINAAVKQALQVQDCIVPDVPTEQTAYNLHELETEYNETWAYEKAMNF